MVLATASSHDTRVYLGFPSAPSRATKGRGHDSFVSGDRPGSVSLSSCVPVHVAVSGHPEPSAGSPAAEKEADTC